MKYRDLMKTKAVRFNEVRTVTGDGANDGDYRWDQHVFSWVRVDTPPTVKKQEEKKPQTVQPIISHPQENKKPEPEMRRPEPTVKPLKPWESDGEKPSPPPVSHVKPEVKIVPVESVVVKEEPKAQEPPQVEEKVVIAPEVIVEPPKEPITLPAVPIAPVEEKKIEETTNVSEQTQPVQEETKPKMPPAHMMPAPQKKPVNIPVTPAPKPLPNTSTNTVRVPVVPNTNAKIAEQIRERRASGKNS